MNETRAVGGLTALFGATLFVVYRLENSVLWVLWGASMVVLAGAALIVLNRS